MKAIKAFVHSHRIADVIAELQEFGQCDLSATSGCRNLTVFALTGILKADNVKERRYSVELAQEVTQELKLELLCEDEQVDQLIEIIQRSARTAHGYGGWIYVTDIYRAVQIAADGN